MILWVLPSFKCGITASMGAQEMGCEVQSLTQSQDVDFIMENKDGEKPPQPQYGLETFRPTSLRNEGTLANGSRQSRYSDIKNIPQRTASGEVSSKPARPKDEEKPLPVPSADQAAAAASSSKIDINANPIYPPAGKPITQVNIDTGKPDHHCPRPSLRLNE